MLQINVELYTHLQKLCSTVLRLQSGVDYHTVTKAASATYKYEKKTHTPGMRTKTNNMVEGYDAMNNDGRLVKFVASFKIPW